MSAFTSNAPHWFFFACLAVGFAGYALVGMLRLLGRRQRASAEYRGLVVEHRPPWHPRGTTPPVEPAPVIKVSATRIREVGS